MKKLITLFIIYVITLGNIANAEIIINTNNGILESKSTRPGHTVISCFADDKQPQNCEWSNKWYANELTTGRFVAWSGYSYVTDYKEVFYNGKSIKFFEVHK